MLDGACRIDKALQRVAEMDMPALAITDHGTLFGMVTFYEAARKAGIKPILGCEVYVATGSRLDRDSGPSNYANHLVLLAKDNEGYANLCRLGSKAYLEGFYYKPRVDKELLRQHSGGLIALSGCLKGEIASLCLKGHVDKAVEVAEDFADIFGRDNFYIEIMDHGMEDQKQANIGIKEVSARTGLPLVATNDAHYIRQEDSEAHEVMLCLQTQTYMSDPKRMQYGSDQFYLKSTEQMRELFADVPEAIENTSEIAHRCNVELKLGLEAPLHFPLYQVPEGLTQKEYLIKLAQEGLKKRYALEDADNPSSDAEREIVERLQHEIEVIEQTGFINYFLVVWDFIAAARQRKIPVGPGRGSGAGSLVAYALEITGIDPIKYGLIFERFLNPERLSPPDFDIDFCPTRRGEVIEYVREKYGEENVAQIITFGTLGAKTVIRDVGRVLEVDLGECDRLAKMIPEEPGMTLAKAIHMNPEFKQAIENDENAKRIMRYARVLEGLPRNPGTHAAGVVIGEKPLMEILPLAHDKEGRRITQYEMKPMEKVGLLKMDFLGLRNLTVVQNTLDILKKTRGIEIDIENIPLDDKLTFEMLGRGDTIGIFQLESSGMRDLFRRVGANKFEEICALIALYRPGPMQMLDHYIDRKQGRAAITYDHPLMEPVLKETYGIMIYQEQVQRAANLLAGYSLAEGDILRRAMGKKIQEEMDSQRQMFIEGCRKTNQIPEKEAIEIFNKIEKFAGYGFNKSHSAAYAVVTYQTAYLKSHYPVEFMAGLLSTEMENTDKLPFLVSEAREMDIEVLPPDVNKSDVQFTPDGTALRFGLAGIKNVGRGAVESLISEREKSGKPFKGLLDFCIRMDTQEVNRKTLESLVLAGAFDFNSVSRGRLFANIDFAMKRAEAERRDRASGQTSLFGNLDGSGALEANDDDETLPDAQPLTESEMLSNERDLLGYYISGHPLTEFEHTLRLYNLADISDPEKMPRPESRTRLGGLATSVNHRYTKKNQKAMASFTLELLENSIEVVVFPKVYESCKNLLENERPLMVCGRVDGDQKLKLVAEEIYPLEETMERFTRHVSLHLPAVNMSEERLALLADVAKKYRGNVPLKLWLVFPGAEKVCIDAGRRFHLKPCEKMVHDIHKITGENTVRLSVNRQPCIKGSDGPRHRYVASANLS